MYYKKNILNLFLIICIQGLFLYAFFTESYNFKIYLCLFLLPYLNTLKILYEHKNGLVFVYLIYLFLSCLSIPTVELFLDNPLKNFPMNTSWYESLYKEKSIIISQIFILVLCFYSSLFTLKKRGVVTLKNKGENEREKYFSLGVIIVLSFFFFLVYQFSTGNLPLFSTYQEYFSKLSDVPFYSIFIFLYSLSIVALIASAKNGAYKSAFLLILLPGSLLLITGNRGELLYPLLAGIGILIIKGVKINKKIIISLSLVFFIAIPLLGEVRNLEEINQVKEIQLSITDPFTTIGYSLRPLVYTVEWLENGEPFLYGESFIIPFQRGIASLIPGMEAFDYTGQTYNYRERLPTMGYSIIAESYHNFGIFGSFILGPIIIWILMLANKFNSLSRIVISGGIASILINNIRNAFSFVPGQIVMLILIIIVYNILWMLLKKRKKRLPYSLQKNSIRGVK